MIKLGHASKTLTSKKKRKWQESQQMCAAVKFSTQNNTLNKISDRNNQPSIKTLHIPQKIKEKTCLLLNLEILIFSNSFLILEEKADFCRLSIDLLTCCSEPQICCLLLLYLLNDFTKSRFLANLLLNLCRFFVNIMQAKSFVFSFKSSKYVHGSKSRNGPETGRN